MDKRSNGNDNRNIISLLNTKLPKSLAEVMSLHDIETMTEVLDPTVIAEEIVLGGLVHICNVAGGEESYQYTSGY